MALLLVLVTPASLTVSTLEAGVHTESDFVHRFTPHFGGPPTSPVASADIPGLILYTNVAGL